MIRELEMARSTIEQTLLERGAVCDQIDVRLCETLTDVMAYIYQQDGGDFMLLIEMDEIDYFDPSWIKEKLWPRLSSEVLH